MSMSTSEAGKRGGRARGGKKARSSAANLVKARAAPRKPPTRKFALITRNDAGTVWRVSYRGKMLQDFVGPTVAQLWALANGFDGARWGKEK